MNKAIQTGTLIFMIAMSGCTGELNGSGDEEQLYSHTADVIVSAGPLVYGDISIDHNWRRVDFGRSFKDPVVVVKPLSANGGQPGVLRMRGINSTGFDVRIQEWRYLDDRHTPETASFIAVERGRHQLGDGAVVEAGSSRRSWSVTRPWPARSCSSRSSSRASSHEGRWSSPRWPAI